MQFYNYRKLSYEIPPDGIQISDLSIIGTSFFSGLLNGRNFMVFPKAVVSLQMLLPRQVLTEYQVCWLSNSFQICDWGWNIDHNQCFSLIISLK